MVPHQVVEAHYPAAEAPWASPATSSPTASAESPGASIGKIQSPLWKLAAGPTVKLVLDTQKPGYFRNRAICGR